jgi:hypothetical protein
MARNFQAWLFSIFFLSTVSCTVAVPEVSSLTELTSFSSKTGSLFSQDNLGSVLYISGVCLPGVTGFEFRMNEFELWSSVSPTPPSPGADEYLIGNPEYDLDCSDGTFNFYFFISTVMSNFDLNAQTQLAGDPSSIQIRALGVPGLPTLTFYRPKPISFYIENYYGSFFSNGLNYLASGDKQQLTIQMNDEFGQQAMLGAGDSKEITFTLTNLTNSSQSAGALYDDTCLVPMTTALSTFNPGQDELKFCYDSSGVPTHSRIRLEISAPNMIPLYYDFYVQPVYTAISEIYFSSTGEKNPPTLLRGVDYNLYMGLRPLVNNSGSSNVDQFSGNFQIESSNGVSLMRVGTDPECPSTTQNASMTCNSTLPQKNFTLRIENSYLLPYVTFKVTATEQATCGSGCTIYSGGSSFPITDYLKSSITFSVVSGPNVFDQPFFAPQDPSTHLGNCETLQLGLANENGTLIPAIAKTLNVTTTGNSAEFFTDYNCGTSYGTSQDVTFALGDFAHQVYYRVDTMPVDGVVNWKFDDGTSTWTIPYYVKSNN